MTFLSRKTGGREEGTRGRRGRRGGEGRRVMGKDFREASVEVNFFFGNVRLFVFSFLLFCVSGFVIVSVIFG